MLHSSPRLPIWFLALGAVLCLAVPRAAAIQVSASTLPPDTTLQILTGSVTYGPINVIGTTTETSGQTPVPTTYPYLVYATGTDIYGNQVYFSLAQGSLTVAGPGTVAAPGGGTNVVPATSDSIPAGVWTVPDDGTLHNVVSGYRIFVVIYQPGSFPADVTGLIANTALPPLVSGQLNVDVLPDLAVGSPGVVYAAGRYRGADIIRFNNIWRNDPIGEGGRQSRPLRSTTADRYVSDLRLTTNPAFSDANNDDFLLSRFVFRGDVPAIPDGQSVLRKVVVTGTPGPLPPEGIPGITGTQRVYTPQPDDGFLDIGESVEVQLETLIPENYSNAYFVALRVAMAEEAEDAELTNNIFVSNEKNKIEILETDSPLLEPASAISSDNGVYVQGGDAVSDYSTVSENGDLVAFASRARNLLVTPQLGAQVVAAFGPDVDMASPEVLQSDFGAQVAEALTEGQQIFVKYRETREVALASRDAAGLEANADCFNPFISADARYVAFDSQANNLIAEPTGNRAVVYVSGTESPSMVAVSRSSAGELADGDSFNPALSQSGRFVVFESMARNLDPARPVPPTNSNQQIYLHDRDVSGNGVFDEAGDIATYLVSINLAGDVADGWCANPVVNLEDTEAQLAANGGIHVAFTSYASNLPQGTGYAMVYRVTVDPASGALPASVTAVSVNDLGAAPEAIGVDPVGAFIQPYADEAAINGDGSQIVFSSAANNFVYNPNDGTYSPTFPNNQPNDPAAPVDPLVVPGGDYNRVPDVFVRDLEAGTTVRVSVSQQRVATGTITFVPSSIAGNVPSGQPVAGEVITLNDGLTEVTLVFGTDVPLGATVFETRDNLVNAINASGLNLVAAATNPPDVNPPGTAYFASIYLRNLLPGEAGNRAMATDSAALLVEGMAGGGIQADEDVLTSQGVPFGSVQPSIDRSGRMIAFRSNAYNLDVHVATPENTYPTSPAPGELIRPLIFPTANIYLHDRQADSDPASGFDAPLNTTTKRVSLNRFGYKTYIDANAIPGVNADSSANNSRPAISPSGRFISFSSDSRGEGGLVFGANNLTPLDNLNVRDVFLRDQRTVGATPPGPETKPVVVINAPDNGLRVPPGSTIAVSAGVTPRPGKTISSVQLFVNGVAVGAPLTAEPYAWTYTLRSAGDYTIRVVATDSRGVTNGETVAVSAVAPVGEAPTVTIIQPTGGFGRFVLGSEVFFNILASDPDGVVPGSVSLFFNGSKQLGVEAGFDDKYWAVYRPQSLAGATAFASATDDDGNTTISTSLPLEFAPPSIPLPVAQILPLNPGLPVVAGGEVLLRARVNLFGADPGTSVVQFYADGIYLGDASLQEDGTYQYVWEIPEAPRNYSEIKAYVISPNTTVIQGSDAGDQFNVFYAARASENFLTVNAETGTPPTVSITSPVPGASATLGQPLTIQASASAIGTTIREVFFYANGQLIASNPDTGVTNPATQDPYTITFVPPSSGLYNLVALAVTETGLKAQSAPITVSVTSGTPPTVTLNVNGPDSSGPMVDVEPPQLSAVPEGDFMVYRFDQMVGTDYIVEETSNLMTGPWVPSTSVLVRRAVIQPAGLPSDYQRSEFRVQVERGTSKFFRVRYPEKAAAPLALAVSQTAQLTANANSTTSIIDRVEFYVNGLLVHTDNESPYNFDLPLTAPGRYEIVARAIDRLGNVTESETKTIIVNVPVGSLSVSFISPAPDITYVPGTTFSTLVSAVSSVDVPVQSVTYYLNGQPITSTDAQGNPVGPAILQQPFSQQVTVNNTGTYVLKAVASDIYGNTATAETTVFCADPTSGGAAQTISMTHPVPGGLTDDGQIDNVNDFSIPSQLFFNAIVTLPAGVTADPSDVIFFASGQPIAGTVTEFQNTYAIRWQPQAAGAFNITAQVTDSRGVTAVSAPLFFDIGQPARPLPQIELLPLTYDEVSAGSRVVIQTRSNQGTTVINRIDFYANGVFIGTAEPRQVNNAWITTSFEWTPPVSGSYAITARAVQTIPGGASGNPPGADNSVISEPQELTVVAATGRPPAVELLQQPIAESIYVVGSQVFLNATVAPRDGATIPETGNPVNFSFLNEILPAEASGIAIGGQVVYTAMASIVDGEQSSEIFALARDSANNVGSSEGTTLRFARPLYPLPTVSMLPLLPGTVEPAGGEVTLRAQAIFPPTANTDARVEFYANGALIGVGTATEAEPDIYTLEWLTPATPGSYLITARALALNFQTNTQDNNLIRHFGSVISEVPLGVNTQTESVPVVSIIAPADGGQIGVGVPTLVQADASVDGSTIAEVRFYANGRLIAATTDYPNPDPGSPFEVSFTATSPGIYNLFAVAVSETGLLEVSDAVQVTASSGAAPLVSLTTPSASPYNLPVNSTLTLAATASDPDGSVVSVTFLANGVPLPSATVAEGETAPADSTNPDPVAPYRLNFTPTSPGSYTIVARAIDDLGNITDSAPKVINSAVSASPTVSIDTPTDGLELPIGVTINVGYSASDPDGSVQRIDLLVNGRIVRTLQASEATPLVGTGFLSYLPPSQGLYRFVVRATDDFGNATDSEPVQVTVRTGATNPLPSVTLTQPSTSLAVVGSQFYVAANAQAVAGASIAPDGVKFYKNNQLLTGPVTSLGSNYASVMSLDEVQGFAYTLSEGSIVLNQNVGGASYYATATDSNGLASATPLRRIGAYAARNPLPTVQMLELLGGADQPAAGGTVTLQARPSFPTTANQDPLVEFYANGVLIGQGTKNANNDDYALVWTTPATPASYVITARVQAVNWTSASIYDELPFDTKVVGSSLSGNPVTVTTVVGVAPDCQITSPTTGTQTSVGFATTITADAEVPPGGQGTISRVEFYSNGVLLGQDDVAPYSFSFTPSSPGMYTLVAIAYSTSGLIKSSAPVTISAVLGSSPTVTLTAPTSGQLGSTVLLAADPRVYQAGRNIEQVEFLANGVVISTDTSYPYEFSWLLTAPGLWQLQARATDNVGNVALSNIVLLNATAGERPTIDITTPAENTTIPINQSFLISATASPGGGGLVQKVDFFVSGVLINTQTTPVTGTSNVYRTTYALPAAGAYTITARVTNTFGQTADSSVTVIAGSPEPGTNAAFIFDMYQLLLYRLPTDEEYEAASIYFEEASSGGVLAPLNVRAQWVMGLMGYSNPTPSNAATGIFNYKSSYQMTSGFAIQPYGRLGLTPNAVRVEAFLEAMQNDVRLLPFPGTEYASIPGAPYGATYGMAAAIQAIFDGTAFQSAYPGVTSLNNGNFVFWLQTNMFDTNTGTGVEVVTMMNSSNPQLVRQGAAAAFLTKFTLECASIGVPGWQPEKDFQLKVNAAALKFQLNESNSAFWDFAGAPFYTQTIVEQYLQQYWDDVQQSP